MGVEHPVATQNAGLKTLVDTIVAPTEAFERLRVAPTWGWALGVLVVLLAASSFGGLAVSEHAGVGMIHHMLATNSSMAAMPDATKQKMLDDAAHVPPVKLMANLLVAIVITLLGALINAALLLGTSAMAQGSATFKSLWAGSINISVVQLGLGQSITMVIAQLRGPENINSMTDVLRVVPSLGWLDPGASGTLGGMLLTISIFALWGLALNVLMLRTTGRVTNAASWIVPVLITRAGATISGAFLSLAG